VLRLLHDILSAHFEMACWMWQAGDMKSSESTDGCAGVNNRQRADGTSLSAAAAGMSIIIIETFVTRLCCYVSHPRRCCFSETDESPVLSVCSRIYYLYVHSVLWNLPPFYTWFGSEVEFCCGFHNEQQPLYPLPWNAGMGL